MATIYGTIGNDTLTGTSGDDEIYGDDGNDTLNGGSGNDLLDGGTGADSMTGGAGNDTYRIDDAGDVIVESYFGGNDTAEIYISTYTMHTNVENVDTRNAVGPISVTGNSSANVFYMKDAETLSVNGGSGSDTASYRYSSSFVLVDLSSGQLDGDAADDTLTSIESLTGSDYDDELRGTSGANVLDGGAGADILVGRGGNDVYVVDDSNDSVVEQSGEGTDEVRTTLANYMLGDYVENLRYAGTAGGIEAIGNALNNDIRGGGDVDVIEGLSGHDWLYGFGGDDRLYGGSGVDVLNGGAGEDYLEGGEDGDVYHVDSEFDQVVEGSGALDGMDIVYATSSAFTLPDNVEDLTYNLSSGNFAGTGNELGNIIRGQGGDDVLSGLGGDDQLTGNGGADSLSGGDGNDHLDGSGGADDLAGGAGADTFRIGAYQSGTGADADSISDFEAGVDNIDVRSWDTDMWTSGDQAFTFIGTASFSNTAGELRYSSVGGDTLVEGDMNGDGAADFEILLAGTHVLTATDFQL